MLRSDSTVIFFFMLVAVMATDKTYYASSGFHSQLRDAMH